MQAWRLSAVLVALLGICVTPLLAQADGDGVTGSIVWSHDDELRGAPFVALGDEGGQLLAHFPASCCQTRSLARLFSAYAITGDPVWVGRTRVDEPGGVASAREVDVHVAVARQAPALETPGLVRVRRWTSSSAQPDWVYTHARFTLDEPRVAISRDGATVVFVSARIGPDRRHDVVALDGATGALLTSTAVTPSDPDDGLRDFVLAGDGTIAALRLGGHALLVDVVAGQVLDAVPDPANELGERGCSLSADGRVLALTDPETGTVRLLQRSGDSWPLVHTWSGAAFSGSTAVAVSDDGSTVAAAFGIFPWPGTALMVVALDVPTRTQTMYGLEILCCDIGYGPADLEIAADGSRFVVGVRGGLDFDTAHRVWVYARDQEEALVSFDSSAADLVDVAMSSDGEHVAVGSSWSDGGGFVVLYALSGSDLRVEGAPVLGDSFDFVLDGASGQSGLLILAGAPAVPPIVIPGTGTLYLDPSALLLLPMGAVQPDGTARLTVAVPTTPALLGVALWAQGALLPDEVLSEDWRKLTLLP